jgi:hypothetical protein
MTKKHILRSVSDIVLAFGSTEAGKKREIVGKKRLAVFCHVSHQAACNWFTAGTIPNGYHYRLHLWAENNQYQLDPAAFGFSRNGKQEPEKSKARRVA